MGHIWAVTSDIGSGEDLRLANYASVTLSLARKGSIPGCGAFDFFDSLQAAEAMQQFLNSHSRVGIKFAVSAVAVQETPDCSDQRIFIVERRMLDDLPAQAIPSDLIGSPDMYLGAWTLVGAVRCQKAAAEKTQEVFGDLCAELAATALPQGYVSVVAAAAVTTRQAVISNAEELL